MSRLSKEQEAEFRRGSPHHLILKELDVVRDDLAESRRLHQVALDACKELRDKLEEHSFALSRGQRAEASVVKANAAAKRLLDLPSAHGAWTDEECDALTELCEALGVEGE